MLSQTPITQLADLMTLLYTWLHTDFSAHPEDYDSLDGPERILQLMTTILEKQDSKGLRQLLHALPEFKPRYFHPSLKREGMDDSQMRAYLYDYILQQLGEWEIELKTARQTELEKGANKTNSRASSPESQ